MKKPNPPKTDTPVVSAAVHRRETERERQARLDREAAARHARFLRTLDRIDRERGGRAHRPALVNETLRADAVADLDAPVCQILDRLAAQADITAAQITAWDAPVIRAICAQVGPRTGDHPQATRCDRPLPEEPHPQATRTRPTALQDVVPRGPRPALPAVALSAALILSAVAGALWLARGF